MNGTFSQRWHLIVLWVVSLSAGGLSIAALSRNDSGPTSSDTESRRTTIDFKGHSIRAAEGEMIQGIPGRFSGIRLDAAEGVIAIGFSSDLSGPFLALLPPSREGRGSNESEKGVVLELSQDGASLTMKSDTGRIVAETHRSGVHLGMIHGDTASAGIHLLDEESIFQLDSGVGDASLARLYVCGDDTALTLGTKTASPQANRLKVLVSGVVEQMLQGVRDEFLLNVQR